MHFRERERRASRRLDATACALSCSLFARFEKPSGRQRTLDDRICLKPAYTSVLPSNMSVLTSMTGPMKMLINVATAARAFDLPPSSTLIDMTLRDGGMARVQTNSLAVNNRDARNGGGGLRKASC